jgi:putative heme-binding domain-containing protein
MRCDLFGNNLSALLVLLIWLAGSKSSSLQADQQIAIGEINFTIPDGFSLKPVANEKLIKWPVVVDWDRNGDLLVVECGGVAKPIVEHNKLMLHRLVRLSDTNRDGTFDKRVVVADQLPLTQGVLSIGRDTLVSAPPQILRLIDEDGDGISERREVWFDGQTITGCANDLHGPYLGRDGWVYWCKGAFAEQQHALLNGQQLKTSASHIFRRRVDGGPLEPVMTGGMDNPVELAITPEGERFFTSTFLQNPSNGLRDGIAHSVYGGVHGKPNKVLDGHLRTGPLMPIMTQLGAAAPSGLICLRSNSLIAPQSPQPRTLVAALFNLQKVTSHELVPAGGGFTTIDRNLVVADRIDFHPTDILEDADGSLLVIDTGGWYDLCCPTSRIDQRTAPGGIYRLSRDAVNQDENTKAKSTKSDKYPSFVDIADVIQATPEQIISGLHDHRPWVARLTQLALPQIDATLADSVTQLLAIEIADEKLDQLRRIEAVWGLCCIGNQRALSEVAKALVGRDPAVAQAACHVIALTRFTAAETTLEHLVQTSPIAVRRAAAEALGRIGQVSSASALMSALRIETPDRALEHSVTFALLELKAIDAATSYLAADTPPRQLQAALTVLDQLGASEKITAEAVVAALSSAEPSCSAAAVELLGKHSDWATKFAPQLMQWINDAPMEKPLPEHLLTIVRQWRGEATVKEILLDRLRQVAERSPQSQRQTLQLLGEFRDSELDPTWSQPVAVWLSKADVDLRRLLVDTLATMDLSKAPEIQQQLLTLAKQTNDNAARLQLLAALPSGTPANDVGLEQAILNSLDADQSGDAQSALRALRRLKLSEASGTELLTRLSTQPPRTLTIAFDAINRLGIDQLDESLLQSLVSLPTARTLSTDQLRNTYRNRSPKLRELAEQTAAALSRAPEDVQAKVTEILAKLEPGDPIRGLQLFRSSKAQCNGCHRLGYVGGEIGPELTRIGGSRTREALLEAILFPSARLEQSYQPTRVLTLDGQVYNGLIKREIDAGSFELQLTVDKSIVLERSEVERMEPSAVSIMPSGMLELLSIQELSDLIALLESGK